MYHGRNARKQQNVPSKVKYLGEVQFHVLWISNEKLKPPVFYISSVYYVLCFGVVVQDDKSLFFGVFYVS